MQECCKIPATRFLTCMRRSSARKPEMNLGMVKWMSCMAKTPGLEHTFARSTAMYTRS